MDLIHTLKVLKNSRKTGVPYDSKSSAWKHRSKLSGKSGIKFQRERPLRRKPPICSLYLMKHCSRNGKRLAWTLPPDPNLLTAAGVTRPMRMGCAARKSWRLSGGHNWRRLLVHEFSEHRDLRRRKI